MFFLFSILGCPILSCFGLICFVLSCVALFMSCFVLSSLFNLVLFCFFLVQSCSDLICLVLSRLVLICLVLSCFMLLCRAFPYVAQTRRHAGRLTSKRGDDETILLLGIQHSFKHFVRRCFNPRPFAITTTPSSDHTSLKAFWRHWGKGFSGNRASERAKKESIQASKQSEQASTPINRSVDRSAKSLNRPVDQASRSTDR